MDHDLEQIKKWTEETLGNMSKSCCFMAIFTNNWLEDSRCLMQFALAVLLDKPLFLLIEKGTKIGKHLIGIIDGYEFYEPNDLESARQAQIRLCEKMNKYLEKK